MTREFAYGVLAGLLLGYLWLRYNTQPRNRKQQPTNIEPLYQDIAS